MKQLIALFIIFIGFAFAGENKTRSANDKPAVLAPVSAPVIDSATEAEFYRTDAVLARLTPQWNQAQQDKQTTQAHLDQVNEAINKMTPVIDQANAEAQEATDALKKACGSKFTPQIVGRHVVCIPVQSPDSAGK